MSWSLTILSYCWYWFINRRRSSSELQLAMLFLIISRCFSISRRFISFSASSFWSTTSIVLALSSCFSSSWAAMACLESSTSKLTASSEGMIADSCWTAYRITSIRSCSSLIGLMRLSTCLISWASSELILTVWSLSYFSLYLRCSSISRILFCLLSFNRYSSESNWLVFSFSKSRSIFLTWFPYWASMSAKMRSFSGFPFPCLRLNASSFFSDSESRRSRFCWSSLWISAS